jgi:hypothetical protein
MLAELDIVVYLKSDGDLARTAERVFSALGSPFEPDSSEEWGGDHFTASGLGFQAFLYPNSGEMEAVDFEEYEYGLEILSRFWCVDLDPEELEGPLSEYYAREIAFELNTETATEILVETTEEVEIFEIESFRRNPQYRLDQSPTTPKVFVVETRQVERPYDAEEWETEGIPEDEL